MLNDDVNRRLLKTYFPEYMEEIQAIFDKNENFTELVSDYLFCKKELKRLSNSNKYKKALEYKETLEDLEKELLKYLKAHKQTQSYPLKNNHLKT